MGNQKNHLETPRGLVRESGKKVTVGASACPARVPIGREYQMAVSTRCINNFHTSGILDTVGGTKFSL